MEAKPCALAVAGCCCCAPNTPALRSAEIAPPLGRAAEAAEPSSFDSTPMAVWLLSLPKKRERDRRREAREIEGPRVLCAREPTPRLCQEELDVSRQRVCDRVERLRALEGRATPNAVFATPSALGVDA